MNLAKRKYTYVSPSIWQLRGITVEEALQENLEDSFTPTSWIEASSFVDKYAAEFVNNPDSSVSHVNEVLQPRKNAGVVWVEVSTRLRYNSDGEIEVVGVSRNIEKRKKADAKIRYISYSDLLTGLANRRFYEDELARIDTKESLPVTLIMVDVNGLKLTNDAFGHTAGDTLLSKVAAILRSTCGPEDTAARIGGDEFVLILPKCGTKSAEDRILNIKQAASQEKVSGIILSVSIGYAVKTDMSEDIHAVLRKAEDGMYKNKLYESPSMRSKTIDLIMSTLYEKNADEMLHSKRVSEFCEAIAMQMNFNEIEINQIKLAGLMHDIGKIGIDERILNSPKTLTAHEWTELRRHSEISYRILSSVNEYAEVAEYVLAHHERWDGSGYPKGLSHADISLKSRIISVADSYDAMTSDHLYRKGLSKEEAVDEIIKCSGTQFDETVAKIFIEKVLEMPWK
jgi:diguanylate cyclase (GGDEF)-like protein